jgi:N-methylhydantoinase B/oxoprolinase/acetone carboxylase alpha subunit
MVQIKTGEILGKVSGGGGGVGNPIERDPAMVLDDVINEWVTPEHARNVYKVAIDVATMTVDEDETQALRQAAAAADSDGGTEQQ